MGNFGKWFKAQFGNRPAKREDATILQQKILVGKEAELLLMACKEYDAVQKRVKEKK